MITKRIFKAQLAIFISILFLSLGAIKTIKTASATPQAFTVTNTNDSGAGSLRQAIEDSNTNSNPSEQDIITFSIIGSGDKTIQPLSSLTITQSVLIDGYTQGVANPNTNLWPYPLNGTVTIQIDNSMSGPIIVGSDDVTLKGLSIGASTSNDLIIDHADNFKLYGSYINSDASGLVGIRSNISTSPAVLINGSNNVEIGSGLPDTRNVFGFCTYGCLQIQGDGVDASSGVQIRGNFFGLAADGLSDFSWMQAPQVSAIILKKGASNVVIGGGENGYGNTIDGVQGDSILAQDADNLIISGNRIAQTFPNDSRGVVLLYGVSGAQIGGASDIEGNTIVGNSPMGSSKEIIVADSLTTSEPSENIVIQNNRIGVMEDGATDYPNSGGITIAGASNNINISQNTIRNSTSGPGIRLSGNAQGVSILGNSIYNNQDIGIAFGDGYIPNDLGDADSGTNGLLNHPDWTKVQESGGDTKVDFITDIPAGSYRIEFFSNTAPDDSGRGEGETYIGYTTVVSTGVPESFSYTIEGQTGISNLSLTATEIDGSSPTGFGATSEFGGRGNGLVPDANLSISKALGTPESYSQGSQVDYTITLTNTGLGTIDPTVFDGSGINPLASSLFTDFMPPGMTYLSLLSGPVDCQASPGTLGELSSGQIFATHSDYGALSCTYNGGDTTLLAGESIQISIRVSLSSDFDLSTPNLVVPGQLEGDPGVAQVGQCFEFIYGPDNESGIDLIDCLLQDGSGNADIAFNEVPHPDLSIQKEAVYSTDFKAGGQVKYHLSITNNGTADADLATFDGLGYNALSSSLFVDYIPEGSSYVSGSNPDILCTQAPGTLGDLSPVMFHDHTGLGLLLCTYVGTGTLAPGQAISTDLIFSIPSSSDLMFTNYATPGWVLQDPGVEFANSCLGAIFTEATQLDFIDCLLQDNTGIADIASAGPPSPPTEENGESSSHGSSGLSGTGQSVLIPLIIGMVLMVSSLGYVMVTKINSKNKEKN